MLACPAGLRIVLQASSLPFNFDAKTWYHVQRNFYWLNEAYVSLRAWVDTIGDRFPSQVTRGWLASCGPAMMTMTSLNLDDEPSIA